MKSTFLTLIVILLAILNSFSQSSTITIFTQDGEKIWVVVDGEKKNKDPQTKVVIDNLKAQNYKFKVIFQDSNIPALDKTIFTKDADNNFHNSSYVVRKDTKGAKYVIRVNSDEIVTTTTTTTTTTTAPANTNTSTTTTINSQPNTNQTNTQTYQQNVTTTTGTPDNVNMNVGINVNETPDGVNMNVNMGGMNVNTTGTVTSSSTTTTTTTTTSNSSTVNPGKNQTNSNNQSNVNNQSNQNQEHHQQPAYILPGYSGPTGCPMPMSNESFNTAKGSISSKSFEDSKLTIAKQVVGNNCLLCSQVKEIMKLFSFEDTKLEFAKFAYKHTFDIGNYYQLNDAFNFESTIEELNQYISNGGN
jgi:hypothetical protein